MFQEPLQLSKEFVSWEPDQQRNSMELDLIDGVESLKYQLESLHFETDGVALDILTGSEL